MNKPKLIISSAQAAILSIIFITIITIWAELSAPLKNWLKNFSGHHWTSKSLLSALLFGAAMMGLYLSPQNPDGRRLKKTLIFLLVFTVLGTVTITLFFAGHHFKLF